MVTAANLSDGLWERTGGVQSRSSFTDVLKHRAQMLTRLTSPSTSIRRLKILGLNIRLVARNEWLRLWPNMGPLLQTEHFAMAGFLEFLPVLAKQCPVDWTTAPSESLETRLAQQRRPDSRRVNTGDLNVVALRYHADSAISNNRQGPILQPVSVQCPGGDRVVHIDPARFAT